MFIICFLSIFVRCCPRNFKLGQTECAQTPKVLAYQPRSPFFLMQSLQSYLCRAQLLSLYLNGQIYNCRQQMQKVRSCIYPTERFDKKVFLPRLFFSGARNYACSEPNLKKILKGLVLTPEKKTCPNLTLCQKGRSGCRGVACLQIHTTLFHLQQRSLSFFSLSFSFYTFVSWRTHDWAMMIPLYLRKYN